MKYVVFTVLTGEIKINKLKLKSPRQHKTNKFVTNEFDEQRNKFITDVSGDAQTNQFGTDGVDSRNLYSTQKQLSTNKLNLIQIFTGDWVLLSSAAGDNPASGVDVKKSFYSGGV